ncbi:hypothetical protein MBCUT_17360 [Methanobrevibacter cuticularis]|uniref:Uncharacterized protein n=1 Tax=Methanobrevibacter cuticularis TaxID=47311 RepID=A0A166D126_9EURY|nr:hypothetical protein [Methanobrevibacter cuticularis]KZX15091.1 hypothetical protein MBCUT_17360 [Methanobrevibacter cuticularis]
MKYKNKIQHNQSCKECKERIFELLTNVYGDVEKQYKLGILTNLKHYEENKRYSDMEKIFNCLTNERGHENFIKKPNLSPVDYYIKNETDKSKEFILEFDESQHFTNLRKVALENYPSSLNLGFDKEKWISLCESLNRHDNDPIFRDEQRAWYDTLRDFAPSILEIAPTVRLFASDYIWCELDVGNENDLKKFKNIVEMKIKHGNSYYCE